MIEKQKVLYIMNDKFETIEKCQFIRNPGQTFAKIDDEIVMLNIEKGEYYSLNTTASRIWSLLCEPKSVDVLVQKLSSEYEVLFDDCRIDVLDCIKELNTKGLITTI